MSEQRHTELPWTWVDDGDEDGSLCHILTENEEGHIATVMSPSACNDDEERANAQYIVTAVNAHEAMKGALEAFIAAVDRSNGPVTFHTGMSGGAYGLALTALRLARGEA